MASSRKAIQYLMAFALALPMAALKAETTDPIKLLVGYVPGAAVDTVARVVADGMRESGYQVIVENRPGAFGAIAVDALKNAKADGSTLLLTPTGNLTLAPHVFSTIRYKPLEDFVGVGTAARMSFGLAVGAQSNAVTLPEFLELAKQDLGAAAFGSPGAGTAPHFVGELLAQVSGAPLMHVPYRGGAAAITDAIGGTIPAVVITVPALLPLHRDDRLRILAISTESRSPALPEVPTFQELGFDDLVISETFAIFAPKATPADTIAELHQAVDRAMQLPRVRKALQDAQFEVYSIAPDELDREISEGYAAWQSIVEKTGYQPEG